MRIKILKDSFQGTQENTAAECFICVYYGGRHKIMITFLVFVLKENDITIKHIQEKCEPFTYSHEHV